MTQVELLAVKECFDLSSIGLAVTPDFAVPPGRWNDFSADVTVLRTDGARVELTGRFC
ncbi:MULTISPECIES: hypothetical protein [Xanthomonas]|uniref:hypothetical protein n=1 Tax=Xanthomonas TaxID=338 RepID=UPI000B14E68E|nr:MULTISPECIES: hypothetical protein [Xanthomonas]